MTRDALDVAFVVPMSGPAGIYGPSCEACGELATDELNSAGGILGREVRLRLVDGSQPPDTVAAEIDALVSANKVHAVAGWHISAVRQKIVPTIYRRVPYIYTALYEGGEQTPGVFLTGETPARQVLPAMRWMARELGVRSWCIVGDDYVWPRATARAARRHAAECGAEIRDEVFVKLGTEEFDPVLRRIERSRAQGVLMFLVGMDAVRFNRGFTEMQLHDQCVRLSPLMNENMLLATGAANTQDLYSAAGFFEMLAKADSLDFQRRYVSRLGNNAPTLTSLGESCYEGSPCSPAWPGGRAAPSCPRYARRPGRSSMTGPGVLFDSRTTTCCNVSIWRARWGWTSTCSERSAGCLTIQRPPAATTAGRGAPLRPGPAGREAVTGSVAQSRPDRGSPARNQPRQ